jgi:coenzyme F420-0:L-glutamate ligase/coenzyme F420-1:gamma-L-glutamate ligase
MITHPDVIKASFLDLSGQRDQSFHRSIRHEFYAKSHHDPPRFKFGVLKYHDGELMQVLALKGLPLIKRGDDVGELIASAAKKNGPSIEFGDVVVVAQSIVSKAEGDVVDLRTVNPGKTAKNIAEQLDKDSREVEIILSQSKEIVRQGHVIISRTAHGFVCANAGVDHSNAEPEHVTLLPDDPDASAQRIRNSIKRISGVDVAVIVSDTQGRPFRLGAIGVAIGVAGIAPLLDLRGRRDLYGKELKVTITSPADALAAAAVSVMGEADEGTPVVIIKDAIYQMGNGNARELVMPAERDLFR